MTNRACVHTIYSTYNNLLPATIAMEQLLENYFASGNFNFTDIPSEFNKHIFDFIINRSHLTIFKINE